MGYNVGDYIQNYLDIGAATDEDKLPKIFWVNWFAKNDAGKFIWPGFGDNSRVLQWILERVEGDADAVETPIGNVPTPESLNTEGLDLPTADLERLLTVDKASWKDELELIEDHFEFIGERLPAEMRGSSTICETA
ncbi:MAG: phosphoenolpyruvate carboxykinase (GTP) [Microthrixaceae bacterium]|nr:phosphoenolpyruvate carboxykinase (GTP) [Microthrixaceae bacterium]